VPRLAGGAPNDIARPRLARRDAAVRAQTALASARGEKGLGPDGRGIFERGEGDGMALSSGVSGSFFADRGPGVLGERLIGAALAPLRSAGAGDLAGVVRLSSGSGNCGGWEDGTQKPVSRLSGRSGGGNAVH
jgi:hypothetical protein